MNQFADHCMSPYLTREESYVSNPNAAVSSSLPASVGSNYLPEQPLDVSSLTSQANSYAETSQSIPSVATEEIGIYDPQEGILNLRGSSTAQITSSNIAKRIMVAVQATQEYQFPIFVSVDKVIQAIKQYQAYLRVIDLSHNAIDIFIGRKILEVVRECPHIEKIILKYNMLVAPYGMTRFFDYDLNLLLKKNSIKEVNIQGNILATQAKWRHLFRENYGKYADAKLVTQEGEEAREVAYHEGTLGRLWFYFFS